jgi:arylsulfatase A-like enzyme
VVFIALDGFDASYLDDAPMPNLRQLATRGSLTTSTGVMTSITNPSWSSIATGAWPETHRNTAYWYDEETGTARSQQRDLAVPTIAQAIREQGGTVMSAQWFILQNYGVVYGDPDGLYTQPGGTCAKRADDAVAVLNGDPVNSGGQMVAANGIPDLIAVYCDTLDVLGHADGSIAEGMPAALAEVDEQIGRVVQATKDAGIYGRTAFVITGDHGMGTFTQGMESSLLAAIEELGYDAELLAAGRAPQPETDVVIVVGGVGSLHLLGDAAADDGAAAEIEQTVAALPHVAAVYDKAEQEAMRMSPKYGELIIEPADGWSLGATPADPAGVHGTTRNLEVPLVLSGAGVRPDAGPVEPRHIDVAPTIAALLGYEPPSGADGRILTEAIRSR